MMKKKIFAVLTALILLCACLPLGAVSAAAAESGTTGDCTWTLDGTHLTISGEGAMKDYNIDSFLPWGRSITSVTIEDGVTTIGECAFFRCDSLTSVTIPDSVTTIGYEAFYYCTSLTSITIPDSVTTICEWAFRNCDSLTSVTIGDSVTTISGSAFDNTGYYNTSSNWENDVLYIGKHLIDAKSSLAGSYNIKEGTLTISNSAFYGCTSLESVTIPDSVTTIRNSAFYKCTSLTSVTIPDSVTTIGGYAFSGCTSLTSVTIPNSVTTIVENAFSGCTSLTDVYYSGDKTDRSIIAIGSYNDPLQNATWHYEHGMAEGENGKEDRPSAEDEVAEGENDEDRPSAENSFNWWIVVAIASLIANAVLLILLLKKKKSE